ncbi:MAG: hypothetical protein ABIH22_01025 [Candidatus Margulisiibacteriota bacterium]
MTYQHKELASGRWNNLTLMEQMANIGSEVARTMSWEKKKNTDYCRRAFERALELLDLTIADNKNIHRLNELTRLREVLADYFLFDNIYNSNEKNMQNYFLAFNYAARIKA